MTPKEKATELVEKYKEIKISTFDSDNNKYITTHMYKEDAIRCAELSVDEILLDLSSYRYKGYLTLSNVRDLRVFWNEVKQELEKL